MMANIIFKSDNVVVYYFLQTNIIEIEWKNKSSHYQDNTSISETNFSYLKNLISLNNPHSIILNLENIESKMDIDEIVSKIYSFIDFNSSYSIAIVTKMEKKESIEKVFFTLEKNDESKVKSKISFFTNTANAHLLLEENHSSV